MTIPLNEIYDKEIFWMKTSIFIIHFWLKLILLTHKVLESQRLCQCIPQSLWYQLSLIYGKGDLDPEDGMQPFASIKSPSTDNIFTNELQKSWKHKLLQFLIHSGVPHNFIHYNLIIKIVFRKLSKSHNFLINISSSYLSRQNSNRNS